MEKYQRILALAFGLAITGMATAQSAESLLKKLVEKGVLTEAEAAELRNEANADATEKPNSWVDSITFKGAVRPRYEMKHQEWTA